MENGWQSRFHDHIIRNDAEYQRITDYIINNPGKEDTFVLDFANDSKTILDSFQPYYEVTSVTEETDINHLHDLKARMDQFQVYWD